MQKSKVGTNNSQWLPPYSVWAETIQLTNRLPGNFVLSFWPFSCHVFIRPGLVWCGLALLGRDFCLDALSNLMKGKISCCVPNCPVLIGCQISLSNSFDVVWCCVQSCPPPRWSEPDWLHTLYRLVDRHTSDESWSICSKIPTPRPSSWSKNRSMLEGK